MIPLATALSAIAATAWADDWVITTAACLICGMVIGRAGVFREGRE
jgi:hypothetical protein